MNIVTTTGIFPIGYAAESAAERLAKVGFKYFDMSFDYQDYPNSPYLSDKWEFWVDDLRNQAEKLGVCYTHSHADEGVWSRSTAVLRSFDAAKLLGVKYIVLHPSWRYEDGSIIEDVDEFIRINREQTMPLVEICEKNDLILLSENLLWGASIDPRNISALVSEINSPHFGWCYDTGHANCFGIRPSVLREADNVPLSLHIQDNHGEFKDEHLLPGDGAIDWKEFLDTLKAIGYKGECVLEAHHQSIDAPDDQRDSILRDLLSRAGKMVEYYTK